MLNTVLGLVTATGVLLIVPQLRMGQRQRHRQFEDLMIQRYWTLLDRMGDVMAIEQPVEAPVAHAYFRLSEDQADMRKAGWITDETWKMWVEGIAISMTSEALRPAWSTLSERLPDNNFRQLRELERLDFDPAWDPCRVRPLYRWVRGLRGWPSWG